MEEHVCGHKVAKVPSYGNVTIDALINKYHATDEWFTWYLEGFLLAHSFPIPPSHNVPFGVFKHLTVTLCQIPQVSDHLTMTGLSDTIRTIFPKPPQDRRNAVPAQFNTFLAFKKPSLTAFSDPLHPLKGMCL